MCKDLCIQLQQCRAENVRMQEEISTLLLAVCVIDFLHKGSLRVGRRTVQEWVSEGEKCRQGLFAELFRGAQILLFLKQAGLVDKILGEACALEVRLERRCCEKATGSSSCTSPSACHPLASPQLVKLSSDRDSFQEQQTRPTARRCNALPVTRAHAKQDSIDYRDKCSG